MIPGMNPRQMKQAMKQLGIRQEDIDAFEVIIRTPEKDIVIRDPSVAKVKIGGQVTWQIMGTAVERAISSDPEIHEEDIETVMEQTGCSKEEAKLAIEATKGDLAEAILRIKEN